MKLPYFPFYPGEWLRSPTVLGMSLEEQGAYLRLLCSQWVDGYIDPEDLGLLIGVSQEQAEEWMKKRAWKRAFEVGEDGMLRNERLDLERQQAIQKTESAAAAAHARWRKHREKPGEKKPRRNAESELQAALDEMGPDTPTELASAMREYMEARRDTRKPIWSKERWLKQMDDKFTLPEMVEAFRTAARAGWASVHPKKAAQKGKPNQALDSLKEWIEREDLPY